MLCQNCGKNEANVRYTQVINGVRKELNLCSDCARKLGVDRIDIPMDFTSFLGDFFNDYAESSLLPSFSIDNVKCKTCGMSYNDFIDTGMFGCSDCYDTFSGPIDSLLKNLHGTAKHIGRGAKNVDDLLGKNTKNKTSNKTENSNKPLENKNLQKLEDLQKQLDKAIKEERYEDAAKIRDKIKEMNK